MPAAIAPIAGAVIGGVMNRGSSSGGSQTQSKEPWEPARELLSNYLGQNGDLNRYYQQNPFNAQQQTAYQNLFSDLDNFRSNIAPQLQGLNNQLLGANYQRAPAGSELGSRGGMIDASQFLPKGSTGLLSQAPQATQQPMTGLLNAQIPIAAGGNYGTINWDAQNPWKNELKPAPDPETPALTSDQLLEDWYRRRDPDAYRQWEINRTYGQTG